jgi:hypothetical protein
MYLAAGFVIVTMAGVVAAHDVRADAVSDVSATGPTLSALTLSRSTVAGCKSLTGTVTLTSPAPAGGRRVLLNDTLVSVIAPLSVTVPEGVLSKKFLIKTRPVPEIRRGTMTASLDGVTLSQDLAVRPIGLTSVTLTPIRVVGGKPVTGTAKLECEAAPGDVTVELGSSNPAIANPVATSLVVPVGLQSQPFDVTTMPVLSNKAVTISGTTRAITKSKVVTVTPAATISPTSLKFGSVPSGTTSKALVLTLRNVGVLPFSILGITIDRLSGRGDFFFSKTSNCGSTLPASQSCTISVKFGSYFWSCAYGDASAKLSVSTSARSSPLVVGLSATVPFDPYGCF